MRLCECLCDSNKGQLCESDEEVHNRQCFVFFFFVVAQCSKAEVAGLCLGRAFAVIGLASVLFILANDHLFACLLYSIRKLQSLHQASGSASGRFH